MENVSGIYFIRHVVFFGACSDEKEIPEPGIIPAVYTLKKTEVSDFKVLSGINQFQSFLEVNPLDYFDGRVELAAPSEIRLENDSLQIIRPMAYRRSIKPNGWTVKCLSK
ncbi:MAG: hypothetical protein LIP01_16160 [Tannerellaceae bacterium]|nr:hypothetical protein [Tannerellaceae bacterium]